MPNYQEANISSFLLRFVDINQVQNEQNPIYRGMIRHIQSGDELSFSQWFEVQGFIQRYFPLENLGASLDDTS